MRPASCGLALKLSRAGVSLTPNPEIIPASEDDDRMADANALDLFMEKNDVS